MDFIERFMQAIKQGENSTQRENSALLFLEAEKLTRVLLEEEEEFRKDINKAGSSGDTIFQLSKKYSFLAVIRFLSGNGVLVNNEKEDKNLGLEFEKSIFINDEQEENVTPDFLAIEEKIEKNKEEIKLSKIIADLNSEEIHLREEANDILKLILYEMKEENVRTISNLYGDFQFIFESDETEITVIMDNLISIRPRNEFILKDVFKLDNFLSAIAIQIVDNEVCGQGVSSTVYGINKELKFDSKLNEFVVKEKQKKVFISAQGGAVKLDFSSKADLNIFRAMQFAASDARNLLEFKKMLTINDKKIKNPGIYPIPIANVMYDIIMKRNDKMDLEQRLISFKSEDIHGLDSIAFFDFFVKLTGIHYFDFVHSDPAPICRTPS